MDSGEYLQKANNKQQWIYYIKYSMRNINYFKPFDGQEREKEN